MLQMLHQLFPLNDVSLTDVRHIICQFDSDQDGSIDFHEFLQMMTQAERRDDEEDEISAAFRVFDKDNDGSISARELFLIMKRLGEDIDYPTARLMVQSVDLDGNGYIDKEEFRRMMRDGFDIAGNGGMFNHR